ncbi:Rha family transcriptional regulator [Erythrobacter litoralis]|uniref:transcriptional regulator n=1 Tax=Erythrobacter litoralis TaxID=39960 RepID=UPI002435490B|nr:YdaS family helix-turn-helix protein [Erythrobacter litoralis]MDG6079776.1 Rha family transcriptional regulator [Erythrobacter litoralis]
MTASAISNPLSQAISRLGSQRALAKICEVTQPAVSLWVRLSKPLPAEHVLKVEAATGISRHELRPDLYPREDTPAQPSAICPPEKAGGSPSSLEGVQR